MTERTYDSLQGVIEGLVAARALGFKNVSVSTRYEPPFKTDDTRLPEKWRYVVSMSETVDVSRPLPGTDEYALLFANDASPVHLHLPGDGCTECADAEPMSA